MAPLGYGCSHRPESVGTHSSSPKSQRRPLQPGRTLDCHGIARLYGASPGSHARYLAAPDWLPDLAEAVVGLRLNAQRTFETVPVTTLFSLRTRLAQLPGDGDYAPWVRWFLADRSARRASPSASHNVAEFAENVLRWDPELALSMAQQALRLQLTNGALCAKLTEAVDRQRFTDRTQQLASLDWSSKRALELSPEDPASWKARACFLERQGDTNAALEAFALGSRFTPNDPGFWERWGGLLGSVGQLDEALQKFNKAFEVAGAQPGRTRLPLDHFFWRRWNFLRQHEDFFKERVSAADFAAFFGVLARKPTTPRELIDLTFLHRGLDRSWLEGPELYRMDLRALPHGRATLAGVEFDIRGVFQLGSALQPYPLSGSGLPIGLKCRKLHFLHASDVPETPGTRIGFYRVQYADGQDLEVPIIYGKHLLAWILESPHRNCRCGDCLAQGPSEWRHPTALQEFVGQPASRCGDQHAGPRLHHDPCRSVRPGHHRRTVIHAELKAVR